MNGAIHQGSVLGLPTDARLWGFCLQAAPSGALIGDSPTFIHCRMRPSRKPSLLSMLAHLVPDSPASLTASPPKPPSDLGSDLATSSLLPLPPPNLPMQLSLLKQQHYQPDTLFAATKLPFAHVALEHHSPHVTPPSALPPLPLPKRGNPTPRHLPALSFPKAPSYPLPVLILQGQWVRHAKGKPQEPEWGAAGVLCHNLVGGHMGGPRRDPTRLHAPCTTYTFHFANEALSHTTAQVRPENMPSESSQTQRPRIVHPHSCERLEQANPETEGRSVVARGRGRWWGVTAHGDRASFWGDRHVLELAVVVAQHRELNATESFTLKW